MTMIIDYCPICREETEHWEDGVDEHSIDLVCQDCGEHYIYYYRNKEIEQ